MQKSAMYDLCIAMRQISQEFIHLQVSQEEFLCMKTLILLNTSKWKYTAELNILCEYYIMNIYSH